MRRFGRPDAGRLARGAAIGVGLLLAACAGMMDSQRPSFEDIEARIMPVSPVAG